MSERTEYLKRTKMDVRAKPISDVPECKDGFRRWEDIPLGRLAKDVVNGRKNTQTVEESGLSQRNGTFSRYDYQILEES